MITVLDSNSVVSMGTIGFIPLLAARVVVLIGQNNGMDDMVAPWANLAAVAVIVCLFVWMLTKHIPNRERANEARQDKRDADQEKRLERLQLENEKRLDRIQADFITALQSRDETSRINAASGHGAMQRIMDFQRDVVDSNNKKIEAFDKLHDSIREMCAKIDRHQQRSDNVA